MNYLKKIIIFFLIGISVNCEEITRINNNVRDDKNWLSMEIEKDEKIKILKTKQKLSLVSKVYTAPNFIISNYSFLAFPISSFSLPGLVRYSITCGSTLIFVLL